MNMGVRCLFNILLLVPLVISTGVGLWIKCVTEDRGSLAAIHCMHGSCNRMSVLNFFF